MRKNILFIFFIALCLITHGSLIAQKQECSSTAIRDTNEKNKSAKFKLLYFIISGGISSPGGDYGDNFYELGRDMSSSQYSGYARNGSIYSFIAGISIYRGWGLCAVYSLFSHELDENGFINENAGFSFPNDFLFPPGGNIETVNVLNVFATGRSFYNDYSFLIGGNKNWDFAKNLLKDKLYFSFGLNLMLGELIMCRQAINGKATIESINYNGSTDINQYTYNILPYTSHSFLFELGAHFDFHVWHHIVLRIMSDLQIASYDYYTSTQIINKNGNIFYSTNSYAGNQYYQKLPNLSTNLCNVTLGIGYEF